MNDFRKRIYIRLIAVMMAIVMFFCEAKIAVSADGVYSVQAEETAYDDMNEENNGGSGTTIPLSDFSKKVKGGYSANQVLSVFLNVDEYGNGIITSSFDKSKINEWMMYSVYPLSISLLNGEWISECSYGYDYCRILKTNLEKYYSLYASDLFSVDSFVNYLNSKRKGFAYQEDKYVYIKQEPTGGYSGGEIEKLYLNGDYMYMCFYISYMDEDEKLNYKARFKKGDDGYYRIDSCTNADDSKKCGENLEWELEDDPDYTNGKKLIITGSGDMYDYSSEKPAPWVQEVKAIYDKQSKTDKKNNPAAITSISIDEGVTSIGDFAFNDFEEGYSVAEGFYTLPSTIKKIGEGAFFDNIYLRKIKITGDIPTFYGDENEEDKISSFDSDRIVLYVKSNLIKNDELRYKNNNISLIYNGYKIAPYSDTSGFKVEQDGWCVRNKCAVPEDYEVPIDKYVELLKSRYKNVFKYPLVDAMAAPIIHLYGTDGNAYGGYCSGMALLSLFDYENKIDLKKLYFNKNKGDCLTDFGQNGIKEKDGLVEYYFNDNSGVYDAIEDAYFLQFTFDPYKKKIKNTDVIEYLSKDNANPLLINFKFWDKDGNEGGHTVVTDTSIKPIDLKNGYYLLVCYDCNNPKLNKYLRNGINQYYGEPIYIKLNVKQKTYAVSGYIDEHNWQKDIFHDYIDFYDYSKATVWDDSAIGRFLRSHGGFSTLIVSNIDTIISISESNIDNNHASTDNSYSFTNNEITGIKTLEVELGSYDITKKGDSSLWIPYNGKTMALYTNGDTDVNIDTVNNVIRLFNTTSKNIDVSTFIVDNAGDNYITAGGKLEPGKYIELYMDIDKKGKHEENYSTDSDESLLEIHSEFIDRVKVTGVSLNKSSLEMRVGDKLSLKANVYPGNATDKSLIWRSNDNEIATVDSKGKVTAKKVGVAYITVLTNDGDCWARCKVTVKNKTSGDDKPTNDVKCVNMIRMYNKNSGEHFYTSSQSEVKSLTKAGWINEGIAWKAPKKSKTPVYRLYNANAGDHHYTISASEKNNLVNVGWKYEGIGWYSDDAKGVPLYRLYNPNAKAGSHHYTISKSERNNLVSCGWKYEGISWYGVK